MNRLSCMIVEDEPVSQEILKRYIDDCDDLLLVATCSSAMEALKVLNKTRVNLMFLDINLPRMSGLDFYKALVKPPEVIFTTAYPQFAVEGFEVNAVDYLVKPFSFERFMKAIARLQALTLPADPEAITLQVEKRIHRIKVAEILFAEAKGDYVQVVLAGRKLLVHNTLQNLLAQLPPGKFVRVHRSFFVALVHIDFVEGNYITVQDRHVPIGETYRANFFSIFKK